MVRMYENNEVHECKECGLMLRVTFAAVPIEPVTCCGKEMKFIGVLESNDGFDLNPASDHPDAYKPNSVYTCGICGIELTILRQALPTIPLDCCGEGMDLMS